MRHKVAGRQLGRDCQHRIAMRRNMAASLFEHETISTTIEKAKEVQSFAEKLITLAKKGSLQARRRAITMLGNRDIIAYEEGDAVKQGTIIKKLFSELGPRYLDRTGGYTRIIHLPLRRLGDNGQLVLLQLVGKEGIVATDKKTARKKAKRKVEEKTVAEVDTEPSSSAKDTADKAGGENDVDQEKLEEKNSNSK